MGIRFREEKYMKNISNINNIPEENIYDPDFQSKLKTVCIGDAIGSEKLYANMDYVKPGAVSVKYHFHSKQEEFYLVMSGSGLLRINGEEIPVKAGDVVSAVAGKDTGHQFINNGSEILQILDVGTREKDDIVTYPDENVILIKDNRMVFHLADKLEGWTSEPNCELPFSEN